MDRLATVPTGASAMEWRPLYRAGSICAALTVVMYLVALALYGVAETPAGASGQEMLDFVVDHRGVYIVKQALWVVPSLLLIVTFVALTVALFPVSPGGALVAGVIGVIAWAGTFTWPATGDGSLVLVMLADRYAVATADEERASFVAAAETLIAFNEVPAPLGVVQALAILLVSLVMLRSRFPRGLAWMGVASGGVGIVSEAIRPWMGVWYSVYGILLFVWMLWLAVALWRFAHRGEVPDVVA